jgi:flavodoxin
MKCLVVYDTMTGNTTPVAKAIAQVLKAKLVKCSKIKPSQLAKYDLIGFGSGVYAMKLHKSLLNLADKLQCQNKKAFIFSTAGSPSLKFIWHSKLKGKLLDKCFEIIGDFSCKGYDNFGPFKLIGGLNKGHPNSEDIKKAKEFARKVKQRVKA